MTVEMFALLMIGAGVLLYIIDKKHRIAWSFVAGIGVGSLIVGVWIYYLLDTAFP